MEQTKERVRCDQCQMLAINGRACHETGCPNSQAIWMDGQWFKGRLCNECGAYVPKDDPCCSEW